MFTNLWKRLTSLALPAKDPEGDRNVFQPSSEVSSLKSEFAIQREKCKRKFVVALFLVLFCFNGESLQ